MGRSLPSKLVPETITVEFDFTDVLEWGESLVSAEIAVELLSGDDALPSGIISGEVSVAGTSVTQDFAFGVPGNIYLLTASALGSSGSTYVKMHRLAVLSSFGRFGPSSSVSLLGILPDGIARVPYTAVLYIDGGHSPFEYDGIFSGAAPFWMGFSVSGAQLICQGTPDEVATTSYTFSPQIEDAANNEAHCSQEITIFHITISGDLGDGYTGVAVSGEYSEQYGVSPVTFSVASGTFPPGITLNADGTYSGTFTTAGNYSWQIQAEDAVGSFAYLDDSCEVLQAYNWYANWNDAGSSDGAYATYDLVWTNPPGNVPDGYCYTSDGILYTSASNASNSVEYSEDYGATWTNMGTTGTISAGGGRLLFDNPYIFLCGGIEPLKRWSAGSWSQPSASTISRANSIVKVGGAIIVASIYTGYASISNDDGDNWAYGTNPFEATGVVQGPPLLVSVGSAIYLAYSTGLAGGYVLKIMKSVDGGNTWSIDYTFPDSGDADYIVGDFVYTGSTLIAAQRATGKVAYRHDSEGVWQLSADTIGTAVQIATGDGKILVGCQDGSIYESLTSGETWALATSPSDSNPIQGISWIPTP